MALTIRDPAEPDEGPVPGARIRPGTLSRSMNVALPGTFEDLPIVEVQINLTADLFVEFAVLCSFLLRFQFELQKLIVLQGCVPLPFLWLGIDGLQVDDEHPSDRVHHQVELLQELDFLSLDAVSQVAHGVRGRGSRPPGPSPVSLAHSGDRGSTISYEQALHPHLQMLCLDPSQPIRLEQTPDVSRPRSLRRRNPGAGLNDTLTGTER